MKKKTIKQHPISSCLIFVVLLISIGLVIRYPGWAGWSGIMALVTAWMVFSTFLLADETRKQGKELQRRALQSCLTTLAINVKKWDSWLHKAFDGGIAVYPTLLEEIGSLPCSYVEPVEKLLQEVLIAPELLSYVVPHVSWFSIYVDVSSKPDFSLVRDRANKFVFSLKQIGCYLCCEARRKGFEDVADVFEQSKVFEPIWKMASLNNNVRLPSIPGEPKEPIYRPCNEASLLQIALQQNEKRKQMFTQAQAK